MAESLANLQSRGKVEYSTSETLTNKVWIDGKPIYRKTVNVGALPNATTKTVAHNILNISNVLDMYGYATGGTDWIPLPRPDSTYPITIWVTATDVCLACTTNQSSRSGYVTLEYTKS